MSIRHIVIDSPLGPLTLATSPTNHGTRMG